MRSCRVAFILAALAVPTAVKGLIVVFISQIDRSYDPQAKPCPDINDVRLPNPLDLKLFDKTCFINDAEVQFHAASR